MGAAQRTRGANAERAVVNWLRGNGWPDARRYLAGDGRQPGDVDVWPGVAVEVKDRAQSAWPTWCEQAVAEAGPNRIPVVVRRTRGVTDVGQWEARIPLLYLVGLGGNPAYFVTRIDCPRTGWPWVRTTFGAIADLIRNDQQEAA